MTHLKGKVVGVAVVNGIINVLDSDDWDDGAKRLLPGNAHVLQATEADTFTVPKWHNDNQWGHQEGPHEIILQTIAAASVAHNSSARRACKQSRYHKNS